MFYKNSQDSENRNVDEEPPDIVDETGDEKSENLVFGCEKEGELAESEWEPFPEYISDEIEDVTENKDYKDQFADVSIKNQKETRKKEERLEEVLKKYKDKEYKDRVL